MCPPALTQLVDAPSNTYVGLRIINATANIAYAEFRGNGTVAITRAATNFTEAYDMAADPFQLNNLALDASKAGLVAALSAELWALHDCEGDACP
jgi:hypothetical protein